MNNMMNEDQGQKIAIIGMSCRFPGAANINEFWTNLVNGVESITQFSDDELRASGVEESLINSPSYVKSRGIIDGAAEFDASFFGVTPRDAEIMDPQHRVFLECAWHALEDGGYNPDDTTYRIGVFGGTGTNFHLVSTQNNAEVKKYASGTSIVTGNDKDYLATRVSYKLNLTGPSLTIQSACSTSMAAVVTGVNSLLSYQCDMVLAGGSTIELPEKRGYLYQEGGLESSDGHCRTFDKAADGTVFSRGAGVVLLKRYEDAIKDGDHVYAVILSGAINNDGNKKVGFTAPSIDGQVNLAIEAIELAGINPETISYVEAHGTATSVGDPIEVNALSKAFSTYSDKKQFCAIGSVKTNIGHTDSASGVAGLIKTALALKYKKIPAHLHFNEANPKIDFDKSPFFVNTQLSNWEKKESPRRAVVNSFGVGGTNACVILEEVPVTHPVKDENGYKALCLSAKSGEALERTKYNLLEFVERHPMLNLDDLTYTYQVGRKTFAHKGALVFNDREELISKLAEEGSLQKVTYEGEQRPIIFMFPGQGNQYLNMGVDLYKENEVFRSEVNYCCDFLAKKFDLNLYSFLFAAEGSEQAKLALEQTYITQPAIFVTSYAMAKVLLSHGIRPEAMIGHSVGEYVAACLSGIMKLDDALTLVATRGALIQDLPGGGMLAVLQNEDKILPFLFDGVEVAAVNNPGLCVVAGSHANIDQLEEELGKSGFFCKKLATSHAFHSAMMDPILAEFEKTFDHISLSKPTIPIISTVTGTLLTDEEAVNPDYWVKHVRKTVRFTDAVKVCLDMHPSIFLEVGPGQSLESAVKRHLEKDTVHSSIRTMKTETEKINDNAFLMSAIANIWLHGADVPWLNFHKHQQRQRISLPGYPFERATYAIDFSKTNLPVSEKINEREPLTERWFSVPVWKRSPDVKYFTNKVSDRSNWLIVHDEGGLGKEIVKLLGERDQEVFEVWPSEDYQKITANRFSIDFKNKAHYELLIKEISASGVGINHIVHLLNYDDQESSNLDLSRLGELEHQAFYSPLYLQQALYTANKLKNLHFIVVANGVFDVLGERVYAPEKALAIGTCRVLIQEFNSVRARFIDVKVPKNEKDRVALGKNIINEALYDSLETVVAYRNNYRWLEGYDKVELPKSKGANYKENGNYLVTGGLGGIGILTAKTIAAQTHAHFILTYHSPIPAREEWSSWLTANPSKSFTRDKIEGVLMLEEMGSKVTLKQVNVADYSAMKALVEDVECSAGKINGVIHSAGAVGGGIIPLKTEDSIQPVFESKFRGTLVLDQVFSDYGLDFFWLYSSITSILGEATRLDYCSANSFLDAFAYYRNTRENDNTTAINWSGWVEVGMAERWELAKSARSNKTIIRDSRELLHFIKEENGLHIYEVKFQPDNDWIINSHFIISQPTVVGTTFIELAQQYAKVLHPGADVELKNLYFISPLMFEKGKDKKVRFVADLRNGKCKFSFKTQPFNKDADLDIWHDHFVGEMVVSSAPVAKNFNLAALQTKLGDHIDETIGSRIVYNAQGDPLIDLGERWDISNKIFVGNDEWLAELKLRDEFVGDTDHFDFHPAMLDKATSFALRYYEGATYLPFSYKSVKAYGKLPAALYAYATLSEGSGKHTDAVSFDITLADLNGSVVMEIEGYTMKQVNDLPNPGKSATTESKTTKNTQNTDLINPTEGADIIHRMLHNSCPAQLIVYPSDFKFMIEDNIPDPVKLAEKKEKLKNVSKSYYARPTLSTSYEEPANEMEKTIAQIWRDILGLDKIGRDDTFTELGGNSLLAIQTIANIVDVLEVELSAQVFYDNPTVRGLAEAVVSSIMDLGDIENLEELMQAMNDEDHV